MLIKIHHSYRDVIAICDTELIGKKFQEGNFELFVKESFYNGEEVTEEELKSKIEFYHREDATFNIVGEKSIKIALEKGIIKEEGVKTIQGVPFALVLM